MKTYKIAILPGDGIGPEIVDAAVKVLDAVQENASFRLGYFFGDAGFHVIRKAGTNLPAETIRVLKKADACLKGPMTTPEKPGAPVSAAVQIRKMFELYANVRPCKTLLRKGIDLVVVRENTEGMYYGKERKVKGGAVAERLVTTKASRRVAEFAFSLARQRRKKLTYVHKANILRLTDGIFKAAVENAGRRFPHVKIEGIRVDAAALQLIKRPEQFDVIVAPNLYGDVLSDEAAQIVGGVGLAPSGNIGRRYGMFEPVHGSAPKYAGKDRANPVAAILACKLMMEFLGEQVAGKRIEAAVIKAMRKGARTRDVGGKTGTREVGEVVARWV